MTARDMSDELERFAAVQETALTLGGLRGPFETVDLCRAALGEQP